MKTMSELAQEILTWKVNEDGTIIEPEFEEVVKRYGVDEDEMEQMFEDAYEELEDAGIVKHFNWGEYYVVEVYEEFLENERREQEEEELYRLQVDRDYYMAKGFPCV